MIERCALGTLTQTGPITTNNNHSSLSIHKLFGDISYENRIGTP